MQNERTELSPDIQPRIRLKKDMIGIHVPLLNRTKLIDGPTAFELGMILIREGKKLESIHAASKRDADDALIEDEPEDDEHAAEQIREEHKAFVFEAMLQRLGIDTDDDLALDEDFMEDARED